MNEWGRTDSLGSLKAIYRVKTSLAAQFHVDAET